MSDVAQNNREVSADEAEWKRKEVEGNGDGKIATCWPYTKVHCQHRP